MTDIQSRQFSTYFYEVFTVFLSVFLLILLYVGKVVLCYYGMPELNGLT